MSTAPQISSRKCIDNWILTYSKTIEAFSEAPQQYNVWSAISVISAVLKNRVWINRGIFKIYPNQYIVLVGPPGVGKGTAIHPAHEFIKSNKPPLANYISDRVTAPRIIELLAKGFTTTTIKNGLPMLAPDSTAVLVASELQTLLGASDWMLPFLCDMWDRGEYDYDTKHKGTSLLKGLCVSLIGACVPEFIRRLDRNTGEAINGGFTARSLFVFASDKSKSLPWPKGFNDEPATKQIAQNLSDDLNRIATLNGEFTFTKGAQILWERAYNSIKAQDDDSNPVKHFKSRQGTHIMKVAMCFSAASNDSLIIDDYCMSVAISLVQGVLDTLDITFRGVGESPLAEATAKVQAFIEKRGICSFPEIHKNTFKACTMEDLNRIMYTLISIGFVMEVTIGSRRCYRHVGKITQSQGVTI